MEVLNAVSEFNELMSNFQAKFWKYDWFCVKQIKFYGTIWINSPITRLGFYTKPDILPKILL
jgi:hypothetical protein